MKEVHKCPVCEGLGFMSVSIPKVLGCITRENKRCSACNGTGIIATDIVTPFSGGREQFDEVFEDKIISAYGIWSLGLMVFPDILKKSFDLGDKVKISCKSGKIIIEKLEEK